MTNRQPGTEDLEKGMLPSHASSFVTIAVIVVVLLATVNSRAIVEWTRQPQPGPVIAALEEPAVVWNGWMIELGPPGWFDRLRRRVQKAIGS
jgi:hypothetical protein